MQHTTALRAAALGIVLASATASSPILAQRAPRGPRAGRGACVQFVQGAGADGRSVTFELTNHCDARIQGTVSWQVSCHTSSALPEEEHVEMISPGQQRVLVASAQACGEGAWSIHNVQWSWRPEPAESATP